MSDKKNDNKNATQRLTDLENAVMSLYNVSDNLAKDFMVIRDAIKLLGNKVDAIVKATINNEQLTDEVLDRLMIENNVSELAKKVENMVLQGVIVTENEVSENSFVVGTESNDEGKVINPRLQFALKALSADLQGKIKGTKVGDTIHLQDGKLNFTVTESYTIQPPNSTQEVPVEMTPEVSTENTEESQDSPTDEPPQTAAN